MTSSLDVVCDHLAALRSGLVEHRWMSRVDPPVLTVFNTLLAASQQLAPEADLLRAIERPTATVTPATLLMLVDQIRVALNGP